MAGLATLFLLQASIGQSQVINGRVLEVGSDRPIAGVSLRLYNDTKVTQAIAISDDGGGFTMRAPRPGHYQVRAERLGYTTALSGLFEVRAEPHSLTIKLVPQPVALDTLEISAEALLLEPGFSQFTRRCKAETAICFNAGRIGRSGAVKVSDVFESIPGFAVELVGSVVSASQGSSRATTRVKSFHGWGCFKIFVDHHGGLMRGVDLNDIQLRDIAGIEVYPSYREVPKELRQSFWAAAMWEDRPCGVGIVWQKPAWGAPVPAVPRI
jgi:hypothetical protein